MFGFCRFKLTFFRLQINLQVTTNQTQLVPLLYQLAVPNQTEKAEPYLGSASREKR
jgi:hypothetical protein